MPKKVLFTASTFSHIINFHLPYLRRFKGLGWQVHVACGGSLPAAEIAGADVVFQLPLEKKMLAAGNFRAVGLLRKKIAAEQYALISTHTSLAAFFTRLATPSLSGGGAWRPAVLNMVHGYLFDDQTKWAKRNILLTAEKLTAGRTDLLLTMNKWDLAAARRYKLGGQIDFIPGVGVDFSRFAVIEGKNGKNEARAALGLRPQDYILIYAAEFSARKSQAVLLQAMAKLAELGDLPKLARGGRLVLVLPGSGALLDECRQLAAKLELTQEGSARPLVMFPGQQHNIPQWYAAADAAVSASRSEGLPFNIMEAMYAGLPVVASRVKGHVDLLTENQTGLLYPYGDAAACAKQLKRLWQETDLAQNLAENARKSVQQYSLTEVFPQVWAQYEKLITKS